jgi:hypothetical protein
MLADSTNGATGTNVSQAAHDSETGTLNLAHDESA